MTNTLEYKTAEEMEAEIWQKRIKVSSDVVALPDGQKLAIVILPLAPSVTPADYAKIKTDIEAVTNIQNAVNLLIDGQVPVDSDFEYFMRAVAIVWRKEIESSVSSDSG